MKTLIVLIILSTSSPLYMVEPPPCLVVTDIACICDNFPCYTAPHKMWVSQKYLTKGRL